MYCEFNNGDLWDFILHASVSRGRPNPDEHMCEDSDICSLGGGQEAAAGARLIMLWPLCTRTPELDQTFNPDFQGKTLHTSSLALGGGIILWNMKAAVNPRGTQSQNP